jgi:hypothetical protein
MILGAHLWFAREGEAFTLPSAGTVSRTSLPGPTDTVWAYLGIIKDFKTSGSADEVEVWKPTPGNLRLDDVIHTKPQVKYTFTVGELGPSGVEFVFRTAKLTSSSTEFTPLAATGGIKGFLKAQMYDQDDTQRLIVDSWVILKPMGDLAANATDLAEVQFEARMLYSTLNNGGLA